MINYPLRSAESHLLRGLPSVNICTTHTCDMAEDDCLNYMELPSDLLEENFAAY